MKTSQHSAIMIITTTLLTAVTITKANASSTLTVRCEDADQQTCVETEIQSFEASFDTCSAGREIDPIDLDHFAAKKHPGSPATPVIQANRKNWINSLTKICANNYYKPSDGSSWANQFMVGYSLNSSYNENNEHEGLQEQTPFAQFGFDGRWRSESGNTLHWEIGGLFASSPTLTDSEDDSTPTESATDVEGDQPEEMPEDETSKPSQPTFNDVSDSLDIYTKVTTNFWADKDDALKDYFTVGALAGFKTRDNITDEQDAVVHYYGLLGEYLYFGTATRNAKNSIPRGKVWVSYLNFEEYGGLEDQKRWLIRGEWQLNNAPDADPDEGRFVVGFKANLGKGADDVGIFFAYRSGFDSIRSFITGN